MNQLTTNILALIGIITVSLIVTAVIEYFIRNICFFLKDYKAFKEYQKNNSNK